MTFLIRFLSTGLGIGYIPFAPGTFATLLAALIYLFLLSKNIIYSSIFTILMLLFSIPLSSYAEKTFNSKDDQRIVIDEIVGFWVSIFFISFSIPRIITAVVIFRFFDVHKPFFIKNIQKLPKGLGVVADDFFAGLLTNLILRTLIFAGII